MRPSWKNSCGEIQPRFVFYLRWDGSRIGSPPCHYHTLLTVTKLSPPHLCLYELISLNKIFHNVLEGDPGDSGENTRVD